MVSAPVALTIIVQTRRLVNADAGLSIISFKIRIRSVNAVVLAASNGQGFPMTEDPIEFRAAHDGKPQGPANIL
jgi:hypothetical protein